MKFMTWRHACKPMNFLVYSITRISPEPTKQNSTTKTSSVFCPGQSTLNEASSGTQKRERYVDTLHPANFPSESFKTLSASSLRLSRVKFYYCEAARSWVFTIPALRSVMDVDEEKVACGDDGWLMMSPMTEAYKLEDVDMTNWNIIAGTGVISTAKEFNLACGECSRDSDCSLNGSCQPDGQCLCYEGWQGRVCNLKAPACSEMVRFNSLESKLLLYLCVW